MDEGKRPLQSGDSKGSSMNLLLPDKLLKLVGGAVKDTHQGEGSSRGQENRALSIDNSSSNASRGGEPQTNKGCNKQPVDTCQRVGESIVREGNVRERNSQEGDDPLDEDNWKLELKEMWLEAGGIWAPEGGEDKELTSGEEKTRSGRDGRMNWKSGWRNKNAGEGGSNRRKRTRLSEKDLPPLPNPPPDMPRLWRFYITKLLGGKEVRLVIQKRLTKSDVNSDQSRVSIPINQIIDSEFLREEEKEFLDASNEKDVKVLCYRTPEEDIGEKVLKLRLWVMRKNSSGQEEDRSLKKRKLGRGDSGEGPKPTRMYILRSGWPQFVMENKLEAYDPIQVWSFRVDSELARDELRLALILLRDKKQEGNSG